jgi:hypothetical protein
VDANFAGLWRLEDAQDPSSVKSWTGLVIFLNNCPVIWQSKLQIDIATSTMEAEYNGLAMAMRDILPLINLMKDIIHRLGQSNIKLTKFHKTLQTKVHEDNTGTLKLATVEPGRMTPRSKHYGIKYNWFRTKSNQTKLKSFTLAQRSTTG